MFRAINDNTFLVGRGKSAAMLAGPNPKKRKLNEIINEGSQIEGVEETSSLRREND
jgi:hypothetical protein